MGNKIKTVVGYTIFSVAYPLGCLLSAIIHIWTIVIAFAAEGLIGALITFTLPGIAELFWFFTVWSTLGTIVNFYCLAILGYLVCIGLIWIATKMIDPYI